jgi:hypothetical protein
METLNKKEIIESCKKIGVAQTAKKIGISASWLYKQMKGENLGGRKRSGRKKKINLI